jgi:hypothetical protein
MFFGNYLSAAVMVAGENGPPVPELARRITLAGCGHDPVRQLAAVLLRMAADGIPLGDIIDDSGYLASVVPSGAEVVPEAGGWSRREQALRERRWAAGSSLLTFPPVLRSSLPLSCVLP